MKEEAFFREEPTACREIYDGRVVHLLEYDIRLPNGQPARREIVRHPGAVCVLPLTEEGEVILVRQFRFPFGRVLTEVPAGKLEKGEDPLACAVRELSEETGAEAKEMISLGRLISSPAIFDEVLYAYLATGLTFGEMHTDPDEFLEVIRMPLEEAVRRVMDGTIEDGKTQAVLLKAKAYLEGKTKAQG